MDLRSIRRQCEGRLQGVAIAQPFDLDAFCQAIAARRGRRLRLLPKPTRMGPCGVWLALPESDYAYYEPGTSRLHQEHIILHEVSHLLWDHQPVEVVDPWLLKELFPHLDPTVVGRVLARTTYSAIEECEAEVMATVVRERVERTRQAPQPGTSGRQRDPLDRLLVTLDSGQVSPDG